MRARPKEGLTAETPRTPSQARQLNGANLNDENAGMTIDQLQEMHQTRPFRPFRIHLADGRHHVTGPPLPGVMLREPVEHAAEHVRAVTRLADAVPLVRINHHARLHPARLQRLVEHPPHGDRAAAVVA